MPTLAEMLAAKKAKSLSPSNQEAPHGESSVGTSNVDPVAAVDGNDSTSGVVAASEPEQLPSAPVLPAAKPITGLRLNTLRLGSAPVTPVNSGANPGSDSGVHGGVSPEPAGNIDSDLQPDDANRAQPSAIGNLKLGGSLVDIAGIGEELDGIDPEEEDTIPLDHIPVSAPSRKLPENLNPQQEQFIKSLDSIYRLHADPAMFVDMVRRIMTDMQENPALVSLLADDDSFTMITGLRQQAGMAQVKKVEAKEKRGTGGGARSAKSKSVEDSVMASLSAFAGMSLD